MTKLLILVLVVAGVYLALTKSSKNQQNNTEETKGMVEDMVRCSYCGIHLPKSESIVSQGEIFCSDLHRREQNK